MAITKTHSKYLFNLMYAAAIAAIANSADAGTNGAENSEWDVSLGAGALNVSTPWKGADDQIALIPLIDIRKGNWHFNGDDLIGYHAQVGGAWGVSVGLGFRDDDYDSEDLQLNKQGKSQIFQGYKNARY